jgi:hypothetical protein
MLDNVVSLRGGQHFALEAEIADRVKSLIMEYEGRISLVSALGILELVKLELKDAA